MYVVTYCVIRWGEREKWTLSDRWIGIILLFFGWPLFWIGATIVIILDITRILSKIEKMFKDVDWDKEVKW